jgi:hypothetical protein
MTKQELAAFILKLLGIYALLESLPLLENIGNIVVLSEASRVVLEGSGYQLTISMYLGICIPFALTAIAGALLLTRSKWIAMLLFRTDRNVDLVTSLKVGELQMIGFSIVGVLVFILALSDLGRLIQNLVAMSAAEYAQPWPDKMRVSTLSTCAVAIVQIVIAMALFFRSKGLSNLWKRIQSGRYAKIENNAEQEN